VSETSPVSPRNTAPLQTWQVPRFGTFVVPLIVLVLGTTGLISWLSWRGEEQAIEAVTNRYKEQVTERIEEHLTAYLEIPSYINQINALAVRSGDLNLNDLDSVQRYFCGQIQTFKAVHYIMLGNPAGDYIALKRQGDRYSLDQINRVDRTMLETYEINAACQSASIPLNRVPDFDPRSRPWYQAAIAQKGATWSPVYKLFNQSTLAITQGQVLKDPQGKPLGVTGVGLLLPAIDGFLDGLKIGRGTIFIVERSGDLIADSGSGNLPKTAGVERIKAIDSTNPTVRLTARHLIRQFGNWATVPTNQLINLVINREPQWVNVVSYQDPYGIDWRIVMLLPESDFMGEINTNRQTRGLFSLLGLGGAIALGMAATRVLRLSFYQLTETKEVLEEQVQVKTHALRQSEEKFFKAFRSSPNPLAIVQLTNGKILEVNDSFFQLSGYSHDQILGKNALNLPIWVNPQDYDYPQPSKNRKHPQFRNCLSYRIGVYSHCPLIGGIG
jgi:PAS domain-containing protein